MEMWCPDDIGRDSWDWVGPPAWERACFNSPEWGGGSSPVKTEPPQIVLLLLLLNGYMILKEQLLLDGLTLAIFFSLIFVGKMCVFVSRPMNIVTFLRKNGYHPKRVVDFPRERDTFRNKIMEIVEDFASESIFSFSLFLIIFLHFFVFFFFFFIFSFFHFFFFVKFFLYLHFLIFFLFLFSFIFFHFLSFSDFFFSFSFIF